MKRPRSDKTEFEARRSHEASTTAYDLSKATGQACLLINGGAGTAVIAFLAKEHVDPAIYKLVPWCLGVYALGVFASAVALFCEMMNADYWNYYWYYRSYEENYAKADHCEDIANRWHRGYYAGFIGSILAFVSGSGMMAYALLQVLPSASVVGPG